MNHPKRLIESSRAACKGCGCFGECEMECERLPEWFKYSEADWVSELDDKGLCACCVHDARGSRPPEKPEK